MAASVVGSVVGGLVGGGALVSQTQFHLTFLGSLAGLGMPAAFGLWMGVALGLGLLFGSIARPAIEAYASATGWLTARIAPLRILTSPLRILPPLGRAAGGVGLLYGLLMGGLVGAVAVPAAVGASVPPGEWTGVVAGYAVFGLFLGVAFGLTLEGTLPVPSLSFVGPTVRASLLAPVLAGAVSGALVYALQPLYLRFLATIPGIGTPAAGLGIWLGLTLVAGLVFAALASGHAARGNGTTGYGVVYGIVLAVFVGLLAVPAAVSALTQWSLEFGDVSGGTLGAFVVYGLVLGSVFGKTVNGKPLRPLFLAGRTRATVLTALVAGVASGFVILRTTYLQFFLSDAVGGHGSVGAGFGVWLAVAVLLGLGFAAFPALRVEGDEYPGQGGLKMGLLYGLVVAVPVGALLMPQLIDALTRYTPPTPFTNGQPLAAFLVFGLVQGVTYGGLRGSGRILPRFLRGRGVPVLGGSLLGAAAGAAFIYAATPGVYLLILGGIVGSPSLGAGIGVWLALSVLLGTAFVPLAARAVESRVGLLRGVGVGAVYGVVLAGALGVVGIPAATNLAIPNTNLSVIAYVVFGAVFGGTYGSLRKRTIVDEARPTPTAVGTTGQRAVVFGSLFGGSVGGLIAHHAVGQIPIVMLYFGALAGYGGSVTVGWAAWLTLCLLLGVAFAVAVGPRLGGYARTVDEFAERDQDVEAVFGDITDQAPITVTATVAGFGYGVIVAVAVGALAFPVLVNATTGPNISLGSPVLQEYFLLAFVAYGVVMGMGYGVIKEF